VGTRRIAVVWLLSLALCEHVFPIPSHPRSGISRSRISLLVPDPGSGTVECAGDNTVACAQVYDVRVREQ
jgi:hypothetical protein